MAANVYANYFYYFERYIFSSLRNFIRKKTKDKKAWITIYFPKTTCIVIKESSTRNTPLFVSLICIVYLNCILGDNILTDKRH